MQIPHVLPKRRRIVRFEIAVVAWKPFFFYVAPDMVFQVRLFVEPWGAEGTRGHEADSRAAEDGVK